MSIEYRASDLNHSEGLLRRRMEVGEVGEVLCCSMLRVNVVENLGDGRSCCADLVVDGGGILSYLVKWGVEGLLLAETFADCDLPEEW